jgi:hypothetical protein
VKYKNGGRVCRILEVKGMAGLLPASSHLLGKRRFSDLPCPENGHDRELPKQPRHPLEMMSTSQHTSCRTLKYRGLPTKFQGAVERVVHHLGGGRR